MIVDWVDRKIGLNIDEQIVIEQKLLMPHWQYFHLINKSVRQFINFILINELKVDVIYALFIKLFVNLRFSSSTDWNFKCFLQVFCDKLKMLKKIMLGSHHYKSICSRVSTACQSELSHSFDAAFMLHWLHHKKYALIAYYHAKSVLEKNASWRQICKIAQVH